MLPDIREPLNRQEIFMHYSILAILVAGVFVLMAGILVSREPGQTLQSALVESSAWGAAFFISFGAETLLFTNI